MKKSTLFLFLSISLMVSAQQSDIRGVVSIHNSQFKTGTRQYVQNAQVEDDFAKATPTTTDATGNFKLVFVETDKGKSVVLSIKKTGLQVVNTPDLTAIAGQTDALKISMAHPDSIAEYRKRLYNIGKSEAEKNLYAQLKKKGTAIEALQKDAQRNGASMEALQKDSQYNAAAIEALQKDAQRNVAIMEKLQHEYADLDKYAKNVEEQAQDLARRYAPINLDDAAPLYQEAFGYFQQGDFEKALQILRGADLIGQADKILAERNAIGTLHKEANQRDSVQQQRTKNLIQVLGLKTDLHKARFELDSVLFCLELRVNLDSLNVDNLWNLAIFLLSQNNSQKAIFYYEKALTLAKSQDEIAALYMNLGITYIILTETFKAEKYLLKSLDIYERLVKSNSQQYESYLAMTAMNLGLLYYKSSKMPEAKKYLLKSLDIQERLTKRNPQQYEPYLAMTAINLGTFYIGNNKVHEAEKYFLKSLDICERLAKSNTQQYESYLAIITMNLGGLYSTNNKISEAEKYLFKSLDIYERLTKRDPQQFEAGLALILNNCGWFYINNEQYEKAQNLLVRALTLRQKALLNGLGHYESEYNQVFRNLRELRNSFGLQKNYAKSVEIQTLRVQSKEILSRFFSQGNSKVASEYGWLSWFQLLAKQYDNAEISARHGLKLDKTQAHISENLCHALLFQNKEAEAKTAYIVLKIQKDAKRKSFQDILKEDFDILEEAGLDKKLLDKARQWIKD